MIKVIELIVVLALLVFSFFAGVKYSDSVKQHAGWLFESKEDDVELPDLSSEPSAEAPAEVDENGTSLENPNTVPAAEGAPVEAAAPATENATEATPAAATPATNAPVRK